jgi:excisionase family DNA binding protein
MDLMKEKWYTVEELAKKLKLHPESIRRSIREGKLGAVRFGKALRIPESSFEEYVIKSAVQNHKGNDIPKKRRSSLRGMIKDSQVDDQTLDEDIGEM